MKRSYRRLLAAGSAALLCLVAQSGLAANVSAETKANLETALQSEAYEFLLYRAYAMQALLAGDLKAAHLFRRIAEEEGRNHFARELAMTGRVGSTANNLADAAKSEKNDQIALYTKFAEAAEKAGDTAAAAQFREFAQDEKRHVEMLQKLQSGKPADAASP